MKKLHEQGMGVREIQEVFGRSFDTISKHVFKKNRRAKTRAKGVHLISRPRYCSVW